MTDQAKEKAREKREGRSAPAEIFGAASSEKEPDLPLENAEVIDERAPSVEEALLEKDVKETVEAASSEIVVVNAEAVPGAAHDDVGVETVPAVVARARARARARLATVATTPTSAWFQRWEDVEEDKGEAEASLNRMSRRPNIPVPKVIVDPLGPRPRPHRLPSIPEEMPSMPPIKTRPMMPRVVIPSPRPGTSAETPGKRKQQSGLEIGKKRKIKEVGNVPEKGKVTRKSLRKLTQEMNEIRKDLEKRESEIREKKRIQFSLRVRKERIEKLESSQSPLFDLYKNKNLNPGSVCVWCGQENAPPQMKHAETQTSPLEDPGAPDPFSLDTQDSESKDRNHEVMNRMAEAGARQRRRQFERRTRTERRSEDGVFCFPRRPIPTGELVDSTSEMPPPRSRTVEMEESGLVEIETEVERLIDI